MKTKHFTKQLLLSLFIILSTKAAFSQDNWGSTTIPTYTNGKVGIGVTSTTYKFEVRDISGLSMNFQGRHATDITKYGRLNLAIAGGDNWFATGSQAGDVVFTRLGYGKRIIFNHGSDVATQEFVFTSPTGIPALTIFPYYANRPGTSTRFNGGMEINGDLTLVGTRSFFFGNSRLTYDQGGSIELGGTNDKAGTGTPYIDFHYGNGKVEDFNVRLINSGDKVLSLGGKFAIGANTVPANYAMAVNGGIITTNIRVANYNSADWWADYVFSKDYELMSLEEVETYVIQNKHLPNIPSAEDVAENGYELAKMDAKLLEKIEELTLYIIQQQKEIEELKKQIGK